MLATRFARAPEALLTIAELRIRRMAVPAAEAVAQLCLDGRTGFTTMSAEDLARFAPIESISLPARDTYALLDINTGSETRGIPPGEALEALLQAGRSPLTIEEGIALAATFPGVLRKNHCFYLGGSSCGDRRVPALWISQGRPRLGWCWTGNPHSWLGMASCGGRI